METGPNLLVEATTTRQHFNIPAPYSITSYEFPVQTNTSGAVIGAGNCAPAGPPLLGQPTLGQEVSFGNRNQSFTWRVCNRQIFL
jgi:hypothetical protein